MDILDVAARRVHERFLADWIAQAKTRRDNGRLMRCYETACLLGLDHLAPAGFIPGSAPGMSGAEIVRSVLARG